MMLDLLSQDCSLQELIDKATELLGNPVILTDNRFRVLYNSRNVKVEIPMWKNALEEKYISNEMITSIVDSELAKGGRNGDAAVSQLPNGYHAMRKPLYYKMQYCGFIGIYDYFREFTEEDRISLGIIAKAVSALICSDKEFISYDDNAYSSLLYQMLGCKTREEARHVLK